MTRRVRVLTMTLTVLVGACSSSSATPLATDAASSSASVVRTSTSVPVPEGTTGCEGMPEQMVPPVSEQDTIVGITVSPWPEGPIAHVTPDGADYPPEWIAGFDAAKAAISLPLPAPGDTACCSRPGQYTLFIEFQSGAHAVYGPCELPGGLDVIASDFYVAAY